MDLTQIDNFQVRLLQILYRDSSDHITLIDTNPTAALLLVLVAVAVLARAPQYQTRPDRIDTTLVARVTTQQLYTIPARQRRQDIEHFLAHGPHPS